MSGKNVIADFVEEIQVKSSGYTAEFGGATGGVINVLTKSGTNDWHGNVLFNLQSSDLSGERRQTPAPEPGQLRHRRVCVVPKDDSTRIEPGGAVGGPVVPNRLWFFGAYQPALTDNERTVDAASSGNPSATAASIKQKVQVQYVTGNVTTQLSDNLRGRVAYNNSWSRTKGLLPALNGTDVAGVNYGKTSTFPNYTVSGNLDWTALHACSSACAAATTSRTSTTPT